jgi:hypothetical protein
MEEVNVLRYLSSATVNYFVNCEKLRSAYLPMGGAISSAGALRIERLSYRFFVMPWSLNEPFFESRFRSFREKLSVCDLLTFRPNIIASSRFRGEMVECPRRIQISSNGDRK